MKDFSKTELHEAYFTLSGDVNSDMVRHIFDAVARMTEDGVTTAHMLLQSHGGFVSDGICLYNYLTHVPIDFVMYNCGAVASIAVVVFLAGRHRVASETARFMLHKSHASPSGGSRPEVLKIIAEGLMADDRRTEAIIREHLVLSPGNWEVHAHADLHLTALEARTAGLIHETGNFSPPAGYRLINI